MAREAGVELPRSTIMDWLRHATDLLAPVAEAIKSETLAATVLHVDDTPVRQLDPGAGKCSAARFWVYRSSQDSLTPARQAHRRFVDQGDDDAVGALCDGHGMAEVGGMAGAQGLGQAAGGQGIGLALLVDEFVRVHAADRAEIFKQMRGDGRDRRGGHEGILRTGHWSQADHG